ncbi:hypothetical protein LG331_09955 [Vreelandella aquamarina]|uniref:hypothetical protein n=1 Tax=Vreelandella aquamarina TaxID=77097 RepID=UPI0038505EE0
MAKARTTSDHINEWFETIFKLEEKIPEHTLRRMEKEISKLTNEYEKSLNYAYLYGIWGRFEEARSWLQEARGFSKGTALAFSGAAKAALDFKTAYFALEHAYNEGWIQTKEDRSFACYIAFGVCAFNLAHKILKAKDGNLIEVNGQKISKETLERAVKLGLEDSDVQELFTRSLRNIEKYMIDKRGPLIVDHCADDEQPGKIVLRLKIAADPNKFGDILWDLCDIDYKGIPSEVLSSIVINPVPAE